MTVFPVHALSLARYRQTFWPSGAKDDPLDAELALDLMLRYSNKIKAIEPSNSEIRLLQQLVEQRRLLVEDKRRFVNRIINTLKQYYPQLLRRCIHLIGLSYIISSKEKRVNLISLPLEHWHLSGYALFTVVGRTKHLTMKQNI